MDCIHTVTRGRTGEKGSWCESCGAKVLEVHDRPCGECKHHWRSVGYSGCRKHLMAVTPGMFVTYYLEPEVAPGREGLCFSGLSLEEPRSTLERQPA